MSTIYILIGAPGHGKTEVAKAIAEKLGVPRGSTSSVVYRELASQLAGVDGDINEMFDKLMRLPKEMVRADLVRVGDKLVSDHGSTILVHTLVEHGCRVIDGVRRKGELSNVRDMLKARGFDVAVWWVERHPAPPVVHDNTTVESTDADMVILNAYPNLDVLKQCVQGLFN